MELYLALSCLQGRPMHWAFDELAALGPTGIQLTPGNAPTVGFMEHVAVSSIPTKTHQGFTPRAIRKEVWKDQQTLSGQWDSVHPPRQASLDWAPNLELKDQIIEIMFPGRALGTGKAVEKAMANGQILAVDVSHIFIQLTQGSMSEQTWRKLQDYDGIAEVHMSANAGDRDAHAPISADTFGLEWAREKGGSGTPVILESYFHKVENDDRRRQMDMVRGTG